MHIDFVSSERCSVGVEMELEVVDRSTRELTSAASSILADLGQDFENGEHPKAKHELLESTVEIITGVCSRIDEARGDLEGTLAEVRGETDRRGLALLCP